MRLDTQRFIETFARAGEHALGGVGAAEIEMREVARVVAPSGDGAFEPGDGIVVLFELDQIRADVVVGIAEFGSTSMARLHSAIASSILP